MEMETNNSYTAYGECRCCLAQGHHRDIRKEYYCNNIREVYEEIFKECFNLSLSTHPHISQLICTTCIQHLRSATSFRMMVVSTEAQLLKAASRDNKNTVFVNVPTHETIDENIKSEVKIEEEFSYYPDKLQNNDTFEITYENQTYVQDDDNVCNDSSDGGEQSEVEIEGESELISRFRDGLHPLPKRCALSSICPKYVQYLDRLRGQIIKPRDLEKLVPKVTPPPQQPKNDEKFLSEKQTNILNAATIFECSNAIAFKTKMRSGFPCFYCKKIFSHSDLRDHQKEHERSDISNVIKLYPKDKLVIYADITDLQCNLCKENMKNLNEFKKHLDEHHGKKMFSNCPDVVVPFKLKDKDFECQICGVGYETFGAIERHMNKHFGHFICEECGSGFVTKRRLQIHTMNMHRRETFPCTVCKKVFGSQPRWKKHYDAVHRMIKNYKCTKCSEKFIDYFTRQKHFVEVHGEEPILYKCNVCDKSFKRKYCLSLHLKRTHLEQRDVKCDLCPYSCYTKGELREHMVKHGDGKKYECEICKKTFLRRKGLVSHMKIHDKS